MKNHLKIILGASISIVVFCISLTFNNVNSAHAQELTHEGGDLYKPGICYLNSVPKAICITPEKLGPCTLVKCK